jgi:hypothetical protein
VAVAEAGDEWQDGTERCLTGHDLSEFDYASLGSNGFVPVNIKPMQMIRLGNMWG